jgi:alkylglycerol monooxygenase
MSQIVDVFLRLVSIGIFAWVSQHFALFNLSTKNPLVWISALLLYDFCYYWLHRMGHEVNLLWAAHVVHHQSEEYNLSTALRQTGSGSLFGWIFYLPMAILGYPLEVFVVVGLIDLLYQFWVHTEQIGRLGWFDRVFVSPSNHRVHHGVNDLYLDKNYGGILILWDRLFGTFVEENRTEAVVYGTRNPLRSWNPLWANLEVYHSMAAVAWRTTRWQDKLRIWFAQPGWRPADLTSASPSTPFDITRLIYHPELSRIEQGYCIVQFVILLVLADHFVGVHHELSLAQSCGYAVWLCAGLVSVGLVMERRWRMLEALRLGGTGIIVAGSGLWFGDVSLAPTMQAGAIILCAVSLACLWTFKNPPSGTHGYLSSQ